MHTTERLRTALADRYELLREIGAGGMATVYLAHDLKHEREVAIKVLHPDLGAALGSERFLAEIKTTAKLQHPHILPLLDSGSADGLLWYAMPYMRGETLRARLERERQLPIDHALRIAREVADALASAHAQGVIHRDIKPENILLQDGHALVADFGIALAVQQAGGSRMTQTGLSLGTPQYMAPEQAMGDKVIDARADVYALGAVTYEMLTGEPPFTGATVQAIVAKILTERPVAPSAVRDTVPPHVEAAVLAALAKNPADRVADARTFADALSGARPLILPTASSAPRVTVRVPASRARRWQALSLLLAGTTVAAAALAWRASRAAPLPPLRRFEVQWPDSVQSASEVGGVKLGLSRDGSRLIMLARVRSRLEVWTRTRDANDEHPIPGYSGDAMAAPAGSNPALSPDGEMVAFQDGGGIWIARVSGGARRRLAEAGSMPAWIDGGDVLYTANDRTLMRVSSAGGVPRVVVRGDSAQGQHSLIWPHALPGGTHALVTVNHNPDGRSLDSMRLALVDLERQTLTPLGVTGTQPRALSNGWVFYGEPGNRLVAAPLSLAKGRFTAPPVLLLDNVSQGSGGAMTYAVADDGTLLYADQESELGDRLVRIGPRGTASELLAVGTVLRFNRVSPDGKQLVGTNGSTFTNGVTLLDLATGAREQLVAAGEGGRAEWFRDGSRIAFLRRTNDAMQLVARRVDRAGPDSVLTTMPNLSGVALGPPDGWAVFTVSGAGGNALARAPMRDLSMVTPFTGTRRPRKPAISPDGRWLAYEDDDSGLFKVYVVPLPGPGPRVPVSINAGSDPRWSPDGKSLYYRTLNALIRATLNAERTAIVARDSVLADRFDRSSQSVSAWDVHPDGGFVFGALPRVRARVHAIPDWRALLARKTP